MNYFFACKLHTTYFWYQNTSLHSVRKVGQPVWHWTQLLQRRCVVTAVVIVLLMAPVFLVNSQRVVALVEMEVLKEPVPVHHWNAVAMVLVGRHALKGLLRSLCSNGSGKIMSVCCNQSIITTLVGVELLNQFWKTLHFNAVAMANISHCILWW